MIDGYMRLWMIQRTIIAARRRAVIVMTFVVLWIYFDVVVCDVAVAAVAYTVIGYERRYFGHRIRALSMGMSSLLLLLLPVWRLRQGMPYGIDICLGFSVSKCKNRLE